MTRPTRALIDLNALAHNLEIARRHAPNARLMAVIKANGYGHGILRVARGLQAADGFAVACLEEALCVQEAGFKQRLLLLEGVFDHEELAVAARHKFELVIHDDAQLQRLEAVDKALISTPLRIWVKLDTGMHRLGFDPGRTPELLERVRRCRGIAPDIVWMTHFANADNLNDDLTLKQMQRFTQTTAQLGGLKSAANSGGILGFPGTHSDWNRPGIMLYGVSPFSGQQGAQNELLPVMQLQTQLLTIKSCLRGDKLGYSGTWTCSEDMPVGIAAVGYGDGYPRHAGTGTPVLVNGLRTQILGRVSMDMILIDLRPIPQAKIGDTVVLWGHGLAVEEVAEHAGTIAYELLCQVTSRVHFEIREHG